MPLLRLPRFGDATGGPASAVPTGIKAGICGSIRDMLFNQNLNACNTQVHIACACRPPEASLCFAAGASQRRHADVL